MQPNGMIEAAVELSSLTGNDNSLKIHVFNDNTGFYVFAKDSSGACKFCKYTYFIGGECTTVPNFSSYAYVQQRLAEDQFFIMGYESSSPYTLHLYKLSYGNATIDWTHYFNCLDSNCKIDPGEAMLSKDGALIHTLYTYINNLYAYLSTFTSSTGSVVSIYQSNIKVAGVQALTFGGSNNYLQIGILRGNDDNKFRLFIFNTLTQSFVSYKYLGNYILDEINEPNTERIIVVGQNSGYCLDTRFSPEAIIANTLFISDDFSMSLVSPLNYNLILEYGVVLPGASQQSNINVPYSDYNLNVIPISSSTSDTYYQMDSQSYLYLVEKSYLEIQPDLPCSSSGSDSIVYSKTDYNSSIAPSWVTVDPNSGLLKISTPSVSAPTYFSFIINSNVSEVSQVVSKVINLRVNKCTLQSCTSCKPDNSQICILCESEFDLISGGCVRQTTTNQQTTKNQQTQTKKLIPVDLITLAVKISLAGTIILTVLTHSFNSSSLQSFWLMFNQLQILLTIILTRIYIPDEIMNIIIGSKLVLNPFDYLHLSNLLNLKLPFSNEVSISSMFDVSQRYEPLERIGVKSESTIINSFSFFVFLFIIGLCHLYLLLISKLFKRLNFNIKYVKLLKCLKWVVVKHLEILTFTYYIRATIEAYQFLIISSVSEIYSFHTADANKIISLVVAFALLTFLCFITISAALLALNSNSVTEVKPSKLRELFRDLKKERKFKIHTFMCLLRVLLLITLLLVFRNYNKIIILAVVSAVQLLYMAVIIIQRAYESKILNLIEILNEIFFSIFLLYLFIYNSESEWRNEPKIVYSSLLVLNNLFILLITITSNIAIGIHKLIKRCSSSKVAPKPPSVSDPNKVSYYEENKSNVQMVRNHSKITKN